MTNNTTSQLRPYRTPEWPSEIVYQVAGGFDIARGAYDDPDSIAFVRDLVEQVSDRLSVHDNTTPVHDLLPLVVWAVLNDAPPELVTFVNEAAD